VHDADADTRRGVGEGTLRRNYEKRGGEGGEEEMYQCTRERRILSNI
jgi:hypothetical protein